MLILRARRIVRPIGRMRNLRLVVAAAMFGQAFVALDEDVDGERRPGSATPALPSTETVGGVRR